MWRRLTSLASSPTMPTWKPSILNKVANSDTISNRIRDPQGRYQQACQLINTSVTFEEKLGNSLKTKNPFIAFVLGGPGSGKGTQCEKIVQTYKLKHISAGDLLRREIILNTEYGSMILNTIKEGRIVSSEITVKLIQRELESSGNHDFLVDGFPRCEENRVAFEDIVGAEPNIVLFFDCPEEEMVKRVLNRNQGRVDDNIHTIKKRLEVFSELNLPVIDYYEQKGKLHKITAVGTVDEIFEQVRPIFYSCKEIMN